MRKIGKIKWGNVCLLIIMLGAFWIVLKDVYMLSIYSAVNKVSVGLTWLGTAELLFAIGISCVIYEYLFEK